MRSNPDHIYETDDDNYPLANWDDIFNKVDQDIPLISSSDTAFNVYSLYTSEKIWPRGLPLQLISKSPSYEIDFATSSSVSVWQGLANEDPDVDALYRLVSDKEVSFSGPKYSFSHFTFVPFNSQNTLWLRGSFEYMYLPSTVNFRFTDILRGYIAQRLLWEDNRCIGFCYPTVKQVRNPHNYLDDFIDEFSMYSSITSIIQAFNLYKFSSISKLGRLREIYDLLYDMNIVNSLELELVDLWISDIESFS